MHELISNQYFTNIIKMTFNSYQKTENFGIGLDNVIILLIFTTD